MICIQVHEDNCHQSPYAKRDCDWLCIHHVFPCVLAKRCCAASRCSESESKHAHISNLPGHAQLVSECHSGCSDLCPQISKHVVWFKQVWAVAISVAHVCPALALFSYFAASQCFCNSYCIYRPAQLTCTEQPFPCSFSDTALNACAIASVCSELMTAQKHRAEV